MRAEWRREAPAEIRKPEIQPERFRLRTHGYPRCCLRCSLSSIVLFRTVEWDRPSLFVPINLGARRRLSESVEDAPENGMIRGLPPVVSSGYVWPPACTTVQSSSGLEGRQLWWVASRLRNLLPRYGHHLPR